MADAPKLFTLLAPEIGLVFSTNVLKEGARWAKSQGLGEESILNRSGEVITSNGARAATLDIDLELYAFQDKMDVDKLQQAKRALAALVYPVKSGIKGGPRCEITLGGDTFIKQWACVCTNIGHQYIADAGWTEDGKARVVGIHVSFKEITDDSVDATKVAGGGYTHQDPSFSGYGVSITPNQAPTPQQTQQLANALSQFGVAVANNLNPGASFTAGADDIVAGLPLLGGARIISQ